MRFEVQTAQRSISRDALLLPQTTQPVLVQITKKLGRVLLNLIPTCMKIMVTQKALVGSREV
jgi:hypothetical protein